MKALQLALRTAHQSVAERRGRLADDVMQVIRRAEKND